MKAVTPSIEVVEGIKKILDNPAIYFITSIIPGTVDDILVAKIKTALPKVLNTLLDIQDCSTLETPDQVFKCAMQKIAAMEKTKRKYVYHSIAALLSEYLSDGKLSMSEAILLAETVYKKQIP